MDLFKKLKQLSLEDVFWTLQYGQAKKRGTIYDLRKSGFSELPPPVFFLSTGRAGTAWFSKLIETDKNTKVLHNPTPTLAAQSKLAYKLYSSSKNIIQENEQLLGEIYLAGRENHLRYSFKTQRKLVETNNGITFFAPVLAELFPKAKFIHLVRPPLEFITSGLKRNYYMGNSEDERRISADQVSGPWDELSQIGKIAYLWSATNKFINKFRDDNKDRVFLYPFQDLNTDGISKLLNFIEVNISNEKIKSMIETPVNAQKGGDAKDYEDWNYQEKKEVTELCKELSSKLRVSFDAL